jgi:ankyrin repeat protein
MFMSNKRTTPIPPQRWVSPAVYDMPSGFWKQQLPAKTLKLAVKGDLAGVKRHLKQHPDDLNRRGSHGRTLLWEAARWGRRNLVAWLLDQGAAIDATGSYNNAPMVQITPYCAAAHSGHDDVATLLHSRGATLDAFRAAFMGELSWLKLQLDAEPALLNAEDPFDPIYFVPLIAFPIAGGQIEVTRFLLHHGVQTLQYSALLLHLAAITSRMDLVHLLLTHEVDVRAVDGGIFVECKDLHILHVLVEHGADVNRAGRNGVTPLAFAVRADKGSRLSLVKWLLEHGANVNAAGMKGQTAMHVAAAAGNLRILQVLMDHGGDVTLKDANGLTPRDIALAKGKPDAANMLK